MEYPNCPNCGLPFIAEWAGGDESKPYCHGAKTGTCFPQVQFRHKAYGGRATINTRSDRFVPQKQAEERPIEAYLLGCEDLISNNE